MYCQLIVPSLMTIFQAAKEFRQQILEPLYGDDNSGFDVVLEENLLTSVVTRKK